MIPPMSLDEDEGRDVIKGDVIKEGDMIEGGDMIEEGDMIEGSDVIEGVEEGTPSDSVSMYVCVCMW